MCLALQIVLLVHFDLLRIAQLQYDLLQIAQLHFDLLQMAQLQYAKSRIRNARPVFSNAPV